MSGSSGGAIVLHDVTLAYDGHPALHHLSGEFSRGSLTAIVGPNGAPCCLAIGVGSDG
jgi:zinc/manganese transport system ATP-binding protein